MYDFKMKTGAQSWDFGSNDFTINSSWGEGDLLAAGYSWPPRSYTCTFCKREFRSAQALGGHMNVHRRDRARLRQSPPPPAAATAGCNNINNCTSGQFPLLNLNNLVDPNPNPNFVPYNSNSTLSSLLTKLPQFTTTLPPSAHELRKWGDNTGPSRDSNGLVTKDLIKMKETSKGVLGFEKFDSYGEKRYEVFKRSEVVRLDLEIGLISESKEEVDLELRLGLN